MRSIAKYAEGASVREEINYVATTLPTTGPLGFTGKLQDFLNRNGLPSIGKLSIGLVIAVIALVVLIALAPLFTALLTARKAVA
jgi:hypothetical protein